MDRPNAKKDNDLAEAIRNFQAGHLQEAATLCGKIIQSNPQNADALNLLGAIEHRLGRYDEAIKKIDQAIKIAPHVPVYHYNIGNLFREQGKTNEAIASYSLAISCKPDFLEAHINLGHLLKKKGRLDEALALYFKALSFAPKSAELHNNIADLFSKKGDLAKAEAYFHRAIAIDPDMAEAYLNLGIILSRQQKDQEAYRYLHKAVLLMPDMAKAHNSLGKSLFRLEKFEEAEACFHRAIAISPDMTEAYSNLGMVLSQQQKDQEAYPYFHRAVVLMPDSSEAHNNLGKCFWFQGKLDAAIEEYDQALQLKPDNDDAHFNKALALLISGKFREGWPEYEWRFHYRKEKKRLHLTQPLWDGSPLSGHRIFIFAEQGYGDSIQFIRYLPFVKERGGTVIFYCQPELCGLLKNFGGIDILLEKSADNDLEVAFDFQVPLLSLPGIFHTTYASIPAKVPYLTPEPKWVEKFSPMMNPSTLNVGLVWSGDVSFKANNRRSCALDMFAVLGRVPGVTFYSLQKGPPAAQIAHLPRGLVLKDIGPQLHDFVDTAALISNLDLIISVDTSVAHLAGAMAKPIWVLLSFIPDWRWGLAGEDCPWHPTMRLFRQPGFGEWGAVFDRVKKELIKFTSRVPSS